MKKIAIGCLIVLAIGLVVGGIGMYFAYERLIKPGIAMAASIKELARLDEIEKSIKNTGAFSAPANGELTEAMIGRFVKVQQHVEQKLGPRLKDLKAKSELLDRLNGGNSESTGKFTLADIATGVKDLVATVIEAKSAQVDALNQSDFSLKEYEWVRSQSYAAAGLPTVGIDLRKFAADAQAGKVNGLPKPERDVTADVPQRNKELVAPYEKQFQSWAPLAFFGL
jgi:hypothetical protein